MIVAYVKSYDTLNSTCDIQLRMIEEYCVMNNIVCEKVFRDDTYRLRTVADSEQAKTIGILSSRQRPMFEEWENLVLEVMNGNIDTILVDSFIRLYRNASERKIIEKLIKQFRITVIEVGTAPFPNDSKKTNLAIYHYTDCSKAKPIVVLKTIDSLYLQASRSPWGEACSIRLYLDTSLSGYNQINYNRIMEDINSYGILLVQSIYHIERKMITFWNNAKNIIDNGVQIYSLTEGKIELCTADTLTNQSMNVAIYDRIRSKSEDETKHLLMERLNLFVECKAPNWIISSIYIDEYKSNSQPKLQQLTNNAAQYDLILMETFGKINDDINRFFKFKAAINNTSLLSLREGGIL